MSVYRRVPMPDDVTALPKLGDMPVPWITEYRVDGHDPKYLNHAAPDGLAIDCTCRLGAGRPQVGKQCVRRQRAAMRHRRCNVCGKHIPGTAIFVGVAAMGSPDRVSSIEAPSHPACAAYSALTCPRLVDSPRQCRVAVIAGKYVIFDRWAVANDETTVMAHGQPRSQFRGRWVGALDLHVTVLRSSNVVTLDEWMTTQAPLVYRELWAEQVTSG